MQNRICKALDIKVPIIQGPMAWISTAPLVAAVSNAGGLGVLGVGFGSLEFAEQQILETKKLTNKPFAINTILLPELLPAITQLIEKTKVPIIYADTLVHLEEDLCTNYFEKWHKMGAKVIVKTGTLSDSVIADISGADVIIAKGWEGGGHTSVEATTVLIPQLKECVKSPIVASGGIADGRGMAASIALGADGIEMGTVFMVATETTIHQNVKDEIIRTGDMSTTIIGNSTGEPCRQIINLLSESLTKVEFENDGATAAVLVKELAGNSLKVAMSEGDIDNGAIMVGQIVPLVKEEKTAASIIMDTISEAKQIIDSLTSYDFN